MKAKQASAVKQFHDSENQVPAALPGPAPPAQAPLHHQEAQHLLDATPPQKKKKEKEKKKPYL
jgi:hypothetical protein